MQVCHYKQTPLALAPDAISEALSRYHGIDSRLVTRPEDVPTGGEAICHFHTKQHPVLTGCRRLIQYHSPPNCCDLRPEAPVYRLVLAQYHAMLPEFAGCRVARNVVNFEEAAYDPQWVDTLRIGFSPSWRGKTKHGDKGVDETVAILDRLRERHGIEYDVIERVPLDECLRRKARCSILIDECKTGSYHRCTLEALALGKVAVCWIRPELEALLRRLYGGSLPVVNCTLERLYAELLEVAGCGCLAHWGEENRRWMERHWHPRDVAAEYVGHYRRLVE